MSCRSGHNIGKAYADDVAGTASSNQTRSEDQDSSYCRCPAKSHCSCLALCLAADVGHPGDERVKAADGERMLLELW
jgi:hypothetical protein